MHKLTRHNIRRPRTRTRYARRLLAGALAFTLAATSALPGTPHPDPLLLTPTAGADPAPTSTVTGSAATLQDTERRLLQGLSDVPDPLPDALHITIDRVTPHIVTRNSSGTVTIEGTLRNVGRLPISDIQLRLQRADHVRYGDQLRHALVEDEVNYTTALPFRRIDKTLKPGAETHYTLTATLTGRGSNSLRITGPGAYPLLVNANGRVNNSASARLHDARTLLPVHHLPGDTNDPATTAPRPFTLLWPLADIPREAAYYSFSSSLILRDDTLPTSLGKDGRLRTLLDAARTLLQDPTLRKSVCLAIDPDLLRTVNRMSYGYRILDDPTNPTGDSSPGKHLNRATQWLYDLKEIASHNCLIALPWSGASLAAAATANQPEPLSSLMQDSRRFVTTLLGTPVTSNIIWPNTGMVTRADLKAADHDHFILAANAFLTKGVTANGNRSVQHPLRHKNPRHGIRVLLGNRPYTGVPFDTTLATALAATGEHPDNPLYSMVDSRYLLGADSTAARMQDAITALLWKTSASMRRETARTNSYGNMPLLVAPPQRWTATPQNLDEFVTAVQYLAHHKLITPTPLTNAIQAANTHPYVGRINTRQLGSYTALGGHTPAYTTIRDGIAGIRHFEDLYAPPETEAPDNFLYKRARYNIYRATSTGPVGASPQLAVTPRGSLTLAEPLSSSYPDSYARSIGAAANSITEAVTLITPGNIYTMASTNSALVLVARNQLPLPVKAMISATDKQGQPVSSPQKVVIPAHSSINVHLATQLPGGEPVPIEVKMRSLSGQTLGEDIHMSVRASKVSPAVGAIFFGAALLLVFLIVKQVLPLIRRRPQQRKKWKGAQGRTPHNAPAQPTQTVRSHKGGPRA